MTAVHAWPVLFLEERGGSSRELSAARIEAETSIAQNSQNGGDKEAVPGVY